MIDLQATQELIALDLKRLSELPSDTDMSALQRILTIWSLTQSDRGYRQGMHEVAWFLWSIRVRESLVKQMEPLNDTVNINELLAPEEVEADTFFLFSGIMQRLASQYFIERAGSPTLIKAILYRVDRILGCHLFELQLEWPPILLYVFLSDLAVVGIVSCIFTRCAFKLTQFPTETITQLWDAMIQRDPSLSLLPYVSTVLILTHRDRLIASDYIETMQLLMHLPTPSSAPDIVREAQLLQMTPTPEMGITILRAHAQQPPSLDTPVLEAAKARLMELSHAHAPRVIQSLLTPAEQQDTPDWSPLSQARLQSESTDASTQRRRAMLSLDDIHTIDT